MAMPIELSTESLQEPIASFETAISCLARLNLQNGGTAGIEASRRRSDLLGEGLPVSRLVTLAAEFGLRAEWIRLDWQGLKTIGFTHPLLILRKDRDVVIVTGGGRSGAEEVSVWDPHHDGVVFFVPREDFERAWNGHTLIMTPEGQSSTISKSQPGRKAAFDTGGNASPTPSDIPKQQTLPSPVRVEGTATSSRRARTPRRWLSLCLRLCLAAIGVVATAGIGVLLVVHPATEEVAATSKSTMAASTGTGRATPATREAAAAPADAAASSPAGPAPEAVRAVSTPTVDAPADRPTPSDAPPLAALPEGSPPKPPAGAAPSAATTPGAQMPEARPTGATPLPAASLTGPAPSAAEIAAILARGDALFRKGDLAAARLFYERAADAGDAQAAIRLGETFDPLFLDHAQLRGARGDLGTALSWYRRARDLGAAEAGVLLKSLEAQ